MGVSPRVRPERLAEKLLEIRNRLDYGQVAMAEALSDDLTGVDSGAISRFETGQREPSLIILLRYARLGRVSMEILVDDKMNLPKK